MAIRSSAIVPNHALPEPYPQVADNILQTIRSPLPSEQQSHYVVSSEDVSSVVLRNAESDQHNNHSGHARNSEVNRETAGSSLSRSSNLSPLVHWTESDRNLNDHLMTQTTPVETSKSSSDSTVSVNLTETADEENQDSSQNYDQSRLQSLSRNESENENTESSNLEKLARSCSNPQPGYQNTNPNPNIGRRRGGLNDRFQERIERIKKSSGIILSQNPAQHPSENLEDRAIDRSSRSRSALRIRSETPNERPGEESTASFHTFATVSSSIFGPLSPNGHGAQSSSSWSGNTDLSSTRVLVPDYSSRSQRQLGLTGQSSETGNESRTFPVNLEQERPSSLSSIRTQLQFNVQLLQVHRRQLAAGSLTEEQETEEVLEETRQEELQPLLGQAQGQNPGQRSRGHRRHSRGRSRAYARLPRLNVNVNVHVGANNSGSISNSPRIQSNDSLHVNVNEEEIETDQNLENELVEVDGGDELAGGQESSSSSSDSEEGRDRGDAGSGGSSPASASSSSTESNSDAAPSSVDMDNHSLAFGPNESQSVTATLCGKYGNLAGGPNFRPRPASGHRYVISVNEILSRKRNENRLPSWVPSYAQRIECILHEFMENCSNNQRQNDNNNIEVNSTENENAEVEADSVNDEPTPGTSGQGQGQGQQTRSRSRSRKLDGKKSSEHASCSKSKAGCSKSKKDPPLDLVFARIKGPPPPFKILEFDESSEESCIRSISSTKRRKSCLKISREVVGESKPKNLSWSQHVYISQDEDSKTKSCPGIYYMGEFAIQTGVDTPSSNSNTSKYPRLGLGLNRRKRYKRVLRSAAKKVFLCFRCSSNSNLLQASHISISIPSSHGHGHGKKRALSSAQSTTHIPILVAAPCPSSPSQEQSQSQQGTITNTTEVISSNNEEVVPLANLPANPDPPPFPPVAKPVSKKPPRKLSWNPPKS